MKAYPRKHYPLTNKERGIGQKYINIQKTLDELGHGRRDLIWYALYKGMTNFSDISYYVRYTELAKPI